MKIDTSGWKEFKLNQIFKITTGACVNKQELEKGKIPRISVKGINNGIQGYFKTINSKNYREEENFISFSFLGTCFYHPYKASLDMKVHCLKPLNYTLNKYSGLFLVNIFKKSYYGVFNDQISSSDLKNEYISLPIDKSGNPDWEYMENTIKATEQKIINIIKKYEFKRNFINNKLLYKDFKLGDLFKIKSNPQLNKNSFEFLDGGEYPYFTRTVYNNGILGYVKYLDEEHKIKGNSIAVGLIAMQFFYMEKDFYAGQFTKTIYPRFDNFNKNIAHYFIAILNKNKNKYLNDFIVKYFERDFKNTMVSLPVNKKGMPDFELMENFIKQIEKENNSLLKMIRKVK